MSIYTQDMFDVTKIEDNHNTLFMQKETLEFQIKVYQEKYDSFRKIKYKDLLVYERKKEFEQSLLPNAVVLKQMNSLESDPSIKEFRQTIVKWKRDLKNINTQISNEIKKLETMFQFNDRDLARYVERFDTYFNNRISFDELMKDIFNKEFRNQNMYFEIKEQRNYDVLQLLSIRAPLNWMIFMNDILSEIKYLYTIEDMKINGENFDVYIQTEEQRRNLRIKRAKNQLLAVENLKKTLKNERTALTKATFLDPVESARAFVRDRQDTHLEIFKSSNALALSQGIVDPANSPARDKGLWQETYWSKL